MLESGEIPELCRNGVHPELEGKEQPESTNLFRRPVRREKLQVCLLLVRYSY
jgi:hypothetical protein